MLVARVAPRAREPVNVLVGVALFGWTFGWKFMAAWTAIVLALHAVPKVGPYKRMLFALVSLLVATRLLRLQGAIPTFLLANAGMRVVFFAFERPAIAGKDRSFVRTLSYCFGMLFHFAPNFIAYTTAFKPKTDGELRVGREFPVSATVELGALSPEDVNVEISSGPLDSEGRLQDAVLARMSPDGRDGKVHRFKAMVPCRASGRHGFAVRVLPSNPALVHPFDEGLIEWA